MKAVSIIYGGGLYFGVISKDYTYAIVGASNDISKYGHKVMKDLQSGGFKVVPINPKGGEILGEKVYGKLSDYPDKIDVVVFIVPYKVVEAVLDEVKSLGITKVWMQPGSQSSAAVGFCEANGIECRHHACIMVERRKV